MKNAVICNIISVYLKLLHVFFRNQWRNKLHRTIGRPFRRFIDRNWALLDITDAGVHTSNDCCPPTVAHCSGGCCWGSSWESY